MNLPLVLTTAGDAFAEQRGGLGTQAGATASLPVLLKQARGRVQCIDTVIKNRFKNNGEFLAQWMMASKVVATPNGGDEPPAPPVRLCRRLDEFGPRYWRRVNKAA